MKSSSFFMLLFSLLFACKNTSPDPTATTAGMDTTAAKAEPKPISEPLITAIYTADPSAHLFDGKIYIYPSHDYEAGVPQDDLGSHFAMKDYHILSIDSIGGAVTDHGDCVDIGHN